MAHSPELGALVWFSFLRDEFWWTAHEVNDSDEVANGSQGGMNGGNLDLNGSGSPHLLG